MAAHVLVVEDDPDLLALLEMVLADAGHRVRTAAHGAEPRPVEAWKLAARPLRRRTRRSHVFALIPSSERLP